MDNQRPLEDSGLGGVTGGRSAFVRRLSLIHI